MRDERVAAAAQWATGGANRCCEEAVVFVNFELWQALPMVKTLQAPNKRRRGKGAGACRWERMRGQRRSLECRKGRGSAVGVGRQNSAGAGGVLGVCGTGRCPAFGGGRGREGERMGNGRTLSEGVAGKKTDGLPRRKTQQNVACRGVENELRSDRGVRPWPSEARWKGDERDEADVMCGQLPVEWRREAAAKRKERTRTNKKRRKTKSASAQGNVRPSKHTMPKREGSPAGRGSLLRFWACGLDVLGVVLAAHQSNSTMPKREGATGRRADQVGEGGLDRETSKARS